MNVKARLLQAQFTPPTCYVWNALNSLQEKKNTNACTLGKSLKEKGTKTLFPGDCNWSLLQYCEKLFFLSAVMQFFSVRLQFQFMLVQAFRLLFRKKCLWFQFFSTSVAQLCKNLNFWWFWAISLVKCWARNWFSSLHKCDVDDDEGRTSVPACLESQSQRSANPPSNETNKPRLSNSCKSRTFKRNSHLKCLSQQKQANKTYVPKGLVKQNSEKKQKFHCFPDRKET